MRYGKIAGNDKPISRIVQGTSIPPVSMRHRDGCFALFDAVFAAGVTAFDTAHQYGDGDAERLLGQWMQERGIREKIFILSKCAHHTQDRKRVTPYDITSDLMDSLARLRSDYIDLYLMHRDDPSVPVGPLVEEFNAHLAAGRIRAYGGSNWSVERIQAANEYAHAHGLVPFTVSSPNFSFAAQVRPPWQDCLTISGPQGQAARDWYAQAQMPLFTWSSFAGGFFSGRFRRDNLDSFSDELDKLSVSSYAREDNFERLDRAHQLAAAKGLTVPQIALAFVLNQPLNIFALVGSHSGAELEENAVACDVTLSAAEMEWLDLKSDVRP
ncbi:MAG: aldo/keto reductase [Chloroflexota bacterium]